jgi:hypothetical protein
MEEIMKPERRSIKKRPKTFRERPLSSLHYADDQNFDMRGSTRDPPKEMEEHKFKNFMEGLKASFEKFMVETKDKFSKKEAPV